MWQAFVHLSTLLISFLIFKLLFPLYSEGFHTVHTWVPKPHQLTTPMYRITLDHTHWTRSCPRAGYTRVIFFFNLRWLRLISAFLRGKRFGGIKKDFVDGLMPKFLILCKGVSLDYVGNCTQYKFRIKEVEWGRKHFKSLDLKNFEI